MVMLSVHATRSLLLQMTNLQHSHVDCTCNLLIAAPGEHRQYLVRATYLEIYQEEVRDLLSKNPNQRLEVKETPDKGVYVKGLVQFVVKSIAEINSVLQVGLLSLSLHSGSTTLASKGRVLQLVLNSKMSMSSACCSDNDLLLAELC